MVSKNYKMHLNPFYDQKTVSANLRNFENKIKTHGKALVDSSNESQNVTGYENVQFDKISSRDGTLEHFEKFWSNFITSGEISSF